ncbi:MAG: ABC transporter ATP-binding protein [Clostridiales bacterium]|nr:ABC transporter ATP-binding protein [Clostridiales bacterium]
MRAGMLAEISLRDVGMTYKSDGNKDVTALTGVTFDIEKGEFVSLLGPSGCGKTTLLRIIADLLEPTCGTVSIGGETPREARQKHRYGIVFQQSVLYDWRTVKNNVGLPLEILKTPRKLTEEEKRLQAEGKPVKQKLVKISREERESRIDKMLELVGLTDFKKHYPNQLSGGMQQRVSIARAFAVNPGILLMDEPFSALDEFTREKLHEDLLSIWRKTNKTVVFVTHNIAESVFLSDRVCVLSPRPGRLSAVVDIDLPRPRTIEMRDTPEFGKYVAKIRSKFEGI